MNKFIASLAFLLICFFVYGFHISRFELSFIERSVKTSSIYYDYKLTSNIHTNQSIGSEPLSVIINEAKIANNNLMLITDLNPTAKLPRDNYFFNLGVLQGAKYGHKDSRFIYYSTNEKNLGYTAGETQLLLADRLSEPAVKNKSSFIILAHPAKKDFKWSGELPVGIDGIEVANLKSLSESSFNYSKVSTIWSLLFFPFNPKLSLMRLFQEPTEEFMLFDEYSQKRHFVAFQGAEASARAVPFADWLVKFPSYHLVLSIASNHLLLTSELTGNINLDNQKIMSALKAGQSYICFDALGDSKGFETYIIGADQQKKHSLGSHVSYENNLKIYFKLPAEPTSFYEVVLYKNGQRMDVLNTFEGVFNVTEKGVYRLQVRVSPQLPLPDATKWLTWIYTNNFYVE